MTGDMKEIVMLKINELQKNIILLKSSAISIDRNNLKQDIIKYWGLERGLQISIECVIDIANVLLSYLDVEKPDTYRETILKLADIKVLPEEFSKQIANMVSFRNILVHDYMKIDEDVLIDVLKNHLDDFVKYIKYINRWIETNN